MDREQGAVGDEEVVQLAVRNDGAVEALDHPREDRERGGRGSVVSEHAVGANGPRLQRGIDGFLHVAAVEVDFRPRWKVEERSREAKHVPKNGAGGGNLIDVETRVYEQDGVEDVVPNSTTLGVGVWRRGQRPFGGVNKIVI